MFFQALVSKLFHSCYIKSNNIPFLFNIFYHVWLLPLENFYYYKMCTPKSYILAFDGIITMSILDILIIRAHFLRALYLEDPFLFIHYPHTSDQSYCGDVFICCLSLIYHLNNQICACVCAAVLTDLLWSNSCSERILH